MTEAEAITRDAIASSGARLTGERAPMPQATSGTYWVLRRCKRCGERCSPPAAIPIDDANDHCECKRFQTAAAERPLCPQCGSNCDTRLTYTERKGYMIDLYCLSGCGWRRML